LFDRLEFGHGERGVLLTCNDPRLPTDDTNLVTRAARAFLGCAGIATGIQIHLEKRIPLAAGLGGGSGNAATTLLGLNRLFGAPLGPDVLQELAGALGSDVPFFLHHQPAIATGRGEQVQVLPPFDLLRKLWLLLIHPGFGVPTAWAYRKLADHPEARNGVPGRAAELVRHLRAGDLSGAVARLYNALERPVFQKFPMLALYQDFCRDSGAIAALMSGSGSTTFAWVRGQVEAEALRERFLGHFGKQCWTAIVPLGA
jgi:4-diphosphocytidyl-2-C-methyl-D-erythritol kinase